MLQQIKRPTLLVNAAGTQANIHTMAVKARRSGVRFRPHFKTHQSADIGEWFREEGVGSITVSSVDMAHYFADHGWNDITVAFPLNPRQMDDINKLAREVSLNVLIESLESARWLGRKAATEIGVWIEIDAGYHRTGVNWSDIESVAAIVGVINSTTNLTLHGFLAHSGNAYGTAPEKVTEIYNETVRNLEHVRHSAVNGLVHLEISVGDTPTSSLVDRFHGVDEIRPGNFVFYDLSQLQFGACTAEQISTGVACPVVAKDEKRGHIAVYGGAVHLSKESLEDESGIRHYGRVATLGDDGWHLEKNSGYVVSLTQEHGIIKADTTLFETTKLGDVLVILPVHSCLTANLFGEYLTLEGQRLSKFRQ